MKLKKGIAAALMAVITVGALGACSGGGDNSTTSNPPAAAVPQTSGGLCTNNPDTTVAAGPADLDKRYNDAVAAQLAADVLETFRAPAGRVYEAGK